MLFAWQVMGEVEVFEKEDARRRYPRRPKHAMDPWVATRVHDIRSNWKAQKSYETMNDRQKKGDCPQLCQTTGASKDWGEHWGC
jgi:hypothetical protein